MQAPGFALRALGRDARGGELLVLLLAIAVAVAALTTVGFFSSRVSQAIREQAGAVLAGDLRLESGRPLDGNGEFASAARARGLEVTGTLSLTSVVFAGEANALATVYGVAAGYPLRGVLRVAQRAYGPGAPSRELPAPGEAWADSRLLAQLGVGVGGELRVGASTLRVTRVLDYRPDQGSALSSFAPTLLVSQGDIAGMRLLGPGSRAKWALLFAGDGAATQAFEAWLRARKSAAERLVDVAESSSQMQSAMERSGRFLNLASLSTLLLAAIAVAMGARRYVVRHLDTVALMKCMGASQRLVLAVTTFELVAVSLVGALAGIVAGYLAQAGLAVLASGIVAGRLPPPTPTAAWLGIAVTLLIVTGFGLPPLLQLRRVPPARVLRRTLGPPPLRYGAPYAVAAGVLLALLFVLVRDARLVAYVAGGIVASGLALAAAGAGLVRLTGFFRGAVGVAWRYGLANVARRGRDSVIQMVAFGLGLTVLLLLAVVRNDLLDEWRRGLPADAPNYFFVNIAPGDVAGVRTYLGRLGVDAPTFAPWVRARLVAVNSQPMTARMPVSERGRDFVEREQNLSWSRELPADNQLQAGRWWPANGASHPEVSVASEFAEALALRVGDRLSFDVAGEPIVATVTSIRKVRWDGFRPNFFLLFSPGTLDAAAGTFMTSVHLAAAQRPGLAGLVRQYPSITVIDVDSILGQVREIMERAALTIQYVFAFTVIAGVIVLLAAIQSTRDERRYESALLRVLGAGRWTVLRGLAAEFVALGMLSGVLAATAASVAGWQIGTRLFGLPYRFDPMLWVLGLGVGVLLVGITGTWATGSVVGAPPAQVLRGR